MMNDARDSEIRRATEAARVSDTLILQKINASHRVAFTEKFPGQCEHILRLLSERLQTGLDKRDGVIVDQPDTWKMSTTQLLELSQSIEAIYYVHKDLKGQ
jgi:Flp pilus assembly CpaE family ATPase